MSPVPLPADPPLVQSIDVVWRKYHSHDKCDHIDPHDLLIFPEVAVVIKQFNFHFKLQSKIVALLIVGGCATE